MSSSSLDSTGLDKHNISAVRELVRNAFNAHSLRRFCHDRPAFRPVLDEFGDGFSFNEMVDALIYYCEEEMLFDELLAEIREIKPKHFQKHFPDAETEVVSQPTDRLGEKTRPPASSQLPERLDVGRHGFWNSLYSRIHLNRLTAAAIVLCIVLVSLLGLWSPLSRELHFLLHPMPTRVDTYFPFKKADGTYRIGLTYRFVGEYDNTGIVRGEANTFMLADSYLDEGRRLVVIEEVLSGRDFPNPVPGNRIVFYVDQNALEMHRVELSELTRSALIQFFQMDVVELDPPLILLSAPLEVGKDYTSVSFANEIPVRSTCTIEAHRRIEAILGKLDTLFVQCRFETLESSARMTFSLKFDVAPEIGFVQAYGLDHQADAFTMKLKSVDFPK